MHVWIKNLMQRYSDFGLIPNNPPFSSPTCCDWLPDMRQTGDSPCIFVAFLLESERFLLKSLADSQKMLNFVPLTSFIHLNLDGMKNKLSKKSRKSVRMFGDVEHLMYLCRWARDLKGQKSPQRSWTNSWQKWNMQGSRNPLREVSTSGRVSSWQI